MEKKNKSNLILVLVLVGLGVGLLLGGKLLTDSKKADPGSTLSAKVYELTSTGKKLVKTFVLEEGKKGTYHFHGDLGVTVVEVDGLQARVKSSPCPDQVCVQFGWLHVTNDFSACLPNAMMVVIEDSTSIGY